MVHAMIESCVGSLPNVMALKPEHKLAVESLMNGKDVKAIFPTGAAKVSFIKCLSWHLLRIMPL